MLFSDEAAIGHRDGRHDAGLNSDADTYEADRAMRPYFVTRRGVIATLHDASRCARKALRADDESLRGEFLSSRQ